MSSCKECGSGELDQVKALARHSSAQVDAWRKKTELLVKKIEETFNQMDKLAHDDSISDKKFIYQAGFLMAQLVDESKIAITNQN